MAVQILITKASPNENDENGKLRVPWIPEAITLQGGETRVAEYQIIDLGKVEVPTGSNLRDVSWQSTFPSVDHSDLPFLIEDEEDGIKEPSEYIDILESWKQEGSVLNVLVYSEYADKEEVSTQNLIDFECILKDYSATFTGGYGDAEYEVSFTEHRSVKTETSKADVPATHTVKSSDTLYSISVKYWGDGSKKTWLYSKNKKTIEKAAKYHGKKSSKKGKYLYATCGKNKKTVLKLK